MTVVSISQPMFFPWRGFLAQLGLSDRLVHLDDAAFSRGSFSNRVQIKTPYGSRWLTVPLRGQKVGQPISDVKIDESQNWRERHFNALQNSYRNAPFSELMLDLYREVVDDRFDSLGDLSIKSSKALFVSCHQNHSIEEFRASALKINGRGSSRVLDICVSLDASTYLTGHGARNYLRHESFEQAGVGVCYIAYPLDPYPQLHGDFMPYVSALDLLANCGPDSAAFITGRMTPWRDFLRGTTQGDQT